MNADLVFADPAAASRFDTALVDRNTRAIPELDESTALVPSDRVTTLGELPGHRVVRVIGAITELDAASGLTAAMKGSQALDEAMRKLRRTAAERGGNAIVGLSASTFGARGGVTSAFGGDAVGVLLIATAVVVEAIEPSDSAQRLGTRGATPGPLSDV